MALRVLLADESPTIKKVFQLALQDFAVEVRPVNIGVDVAAVAINFKPDIIFADVLLQKKNGYEVCAELKQDAYLREIPVVLMWSGFMELDEDKLQACQANAQLEKPFDVAALRKLVTDLVPRTQGQRLSQFLSFPKPPTESEAPSAGPPPLKNEEEFTSVTMPKMKRSQNEKYRLNLKPEELEPDHLAVEFQVPTLQAQTTAQTTERLKVSDDDDEFTMRAPKKSSRTEVPPALPPPSLAAKPAQLSIGDADLDMDVDMEDLKGFAPQDLVPQLAVTPLPAGTLSAEQLERIIREQSAAVIESVVWKVIPELATQIIERELSKLLKERDALKF